MSMGGSEGIDEIFGDNDNVDIDMDEFMDAVEEEEDEHLVQTVIVK